ncbi:MAG: hypothetical protein CMN31_24415 [Sandaracinus sp.]|nr:hypothetical protein [Sandaracinus sp.]
MERGSMSRIWTKGALAAVLAAASLPGAARAQDDGYTFADAEASVPDDPVAALDSDTAALPTRFVARPLTLPRFWIRGDGMALIYRVPDIPFDDDGNIGSVFQLGGAFGITDDLEVGISNERLGATRAWPISRFGPNLGEGVFPLIFTPDFDYGDLPVYGRFRFFSSESFEVAADAVLVIPTNTDFQMRFGLPVRLRAGGLFALDTGVQFELLFAELTPDDDFYTRMEIPLRATINPVDALAIGLHTGFRVVDFDGDLVFLPLGFEAAFSMPFSDTVLVDFVGALEFPYLFALGDENDKFCSERWLMTFGARFHLGL